MNKTTTIIAILLVACLTTLTVQAAARFEVWTPDPYYDTDFPEVSYYTNGTTTVQIAVISGQPWFTYTNQAYLMERNGADTGWEIVFPDQSFTSIIHTNDTITVTSFPSPQPYDGIYTFTFEAASP